MSYNQALLCLKRKRRSKEPKMGRKQTKDNDSDNSSESASEPESETSAIASSTPNKTEVGRKRKSTAELSPPQSAKKAKAGGCEESTQDLPTPLKKTLTPGQALVQKMTNDVAIAFAPLANFW
eukprot:g73924.t1